MATADNIVGKGILPVRLMDLFRELEAHRSTCVVVMFSEDTCQNTIVGSNSDFHTTENMADILENAAKDLRRMIAKEQALAKTPQPYLLP